MKEYHKIETLLDRDEKFKVIQGKWRLPEFEYLQDNQWMFTEKVDGTNIRIMWHPEERFIGESLAAANLEFGGKTDNAQMPPFMFKRLLEIFDSQRGKR